MKSLLLLSLTLFSVSSFAQQAYIAVGTCVLKNDASSSFRILTSDMSGTQNQATGLMVAQVDSPNGGNPIMAAYSVTIKHTSEAQFVAVTPFGRVAFITGSATTLQTDAGLYICNRDN